jgi:hypothetical protein
MMSQDKQFMDNAVLMKIGELGARVDKTEQEVKALQESVEQMRLNMATKDQMDHLGSQLNEIGNWMNKGSGAMWLLATIIPGGIWVYAHWDSIKAFMRAALGIH